VVRKKKSEPVKTPKGVPGGKRVWKLMDRGATIGAGIAARQASALTWQAATRRKPPADTNNPDHDVREVIAWAVLGGAIVELTKVMIHRGAATYWLKSTGQLPPGMTSLKPVEADPDPEPVQTKRRRGRKGR